MTGIACEKCGSAMAAAETLCAQCGAPAPAGKAAMLALGKADEAWNLDDRLSAIQHLERALNSGLPTDKLPLAWRKLGVWLEKEALESGKPELLARAGQAYKQALGMNDADEVAHQLFIANFAKQGQLSQARQFYQARLELNASDAVAQKQLNVVKLSADFAAMPPQVAAVREPIGRVERWLQPRPWKVGMAGLTCVSSLAMVVVSTLHESSPVKSGDELAGLGLSGLPVNFDTYIYDPNLWGFQAALSALAIYLMYRSRSL